MQQSLILTLTKYVLSCCLWEIFIQKATYGHKLIQDIFPLKISNLMSVTRYVGVFLDDSILLTQDSFKDYLEKHEEMLVQLPQPCLRVNTNNGLF